MISELIEIINILEKKGFSKSDSIQILIIKELREIKEVLNEYSNKKL